MKHPYVTSPILDRSWRWHRETLVNPPADVAPWLRDRASLTRRLEQLGAFRVQPLRQGIEPPTAVEARLLPLRGRRAALVREVILYVDDDPVVYARSVLPLNSLRGANRRLSRMANRSLGAELFRAPAARREAVWLTRVPGAALPEPARADDSEAWGRLSLFRKRGKPLLVAEVFLPALWRHL